MVSRSLAPVVFLVSAGHAQLDLTATFVADTELVAGGSHFFQQFETRWPRGTDLTQGAVFQAGGFYESATTTSRWSNTRHGLVAAIIDTHRCRGPYSLARTGSHDALLSVRANQPTLVRLRVAASGTTATYADVRIGSSFSVEVDVDGDGSFDVTGSPGQTQSREWIVQLDAAGLSIRTRTAGWSGIGDTTTPIESSCTAQIEIVPVDAVRVDLAAATPITCAAALISGPRTAVLAAGSSLMPATEVRAEYFTLAAATVRAEHTPSPERAHARLVERASTPWTGSSASATIPAHDVMLVARALRAVPVRVVLRIRNTQTGDAGWTGAVDVGDDGVFELTSVPNAEVATEVAALVDPVGLRVRVRGQGYARNTLPPGDAQGTLEIEVLPAVTCPGSLRGSACAVTLAGSLTLDNHLVLDIATPAPRALCKLLLGTQRIDVPLPFSACRLYVEPMIALPFVADAAGRAWLTFAMPVGLAGPLSAQVLALVQGTPLQLAASRAFDLDCR